MLPAHLSMQTHCTHFRIKYLIWQIPLHAPFCSIQTACCENWTDDSSQVVRSSSLLHLYWWLSQRRSTHLDKHSNQTGYRSKFWKAFTTIDEVYSRPVLLHSFSSYSIRFFCFRSLNNLWPKRDMINVLKLVSYTQRIDLSTCSKMRIVLFLSHKSRLFMWFSMRSRTFIISATGDVDSLSHPRSPDVMVNIID